MLYKKEIIEDNRKLKEEIKRLNNIIDILEEDISDFEEYLEHEILLGKRVWAEEKDENEKMHIGIIINSLEITLEELQKIKDSNKE